MKEATMWNNLADEWNAFVNWGEKEVENDTNGSMATNSSSSSVNGNQRNEQTTKSINGRMDSKIRLHDKDGRYMAKVGLTSKPSWKAEVIEQLTQGEKNG